MYDLNQIPYYYTMDVTNRFKALDLIDRVPEKLWTDCYDIVQETALHMDVTRWSTTKSD